VTSGQQFIAQVRYMCRPDFTTSADDGCALLDPIEDKG
jgi:hypothetical protein